MGYAPGVGKTFQMLDEAHRRQSRGQETVIGYLDSENRQPIEQLIAGFEIVPPKEVMVGTESVKALDLEAILARKPDLVIIDDLAAENPIGSRYHSRWEDIFDILDAGINVLTTVNIINVESQKDTVQEILGVRVSNTVPDVVLKNADEIEMIDVTPKALMNRLDRGDIFAVAKADSLRSQIFEESKLSALRELALREAVARVDTELQGQTKGVTRPWAVQDRILICLSPTQTSMRLLRRGWRTAHRLHCDVTAVYVEEKNLSEEQKAILQEDQELALRLGIKIDVLQGNVVDALINYVRQNGITQIVIGHSTRSTIQQRFKSSIITDLIRELRTIDIVVMATEKP